MVDINSKRKSKLFAALLVLSLLFLTTMPSAKAQTYFYDLRARMDDASKDNLGIQAEIRSNIYRYPGLVSVFVETGEVFTDGSELLFGYFIESTAHAEWTWNLVNATSDIQQDSGAITCYGGVECLNNTLHTYSTVLVSAADGTRNWIFMIDGHVVSALQETPLESEATVDASFVEAFQIANGTAPRLGPFEFSNMSYLNSDGWQHTTSLKWDASGCIFDLQNFSCTGTEKALVPYGVSVLGPNDVSIGSGMQQRASGEIIWSTNPVSENSNYFGYLLAAGMILGVIALIMLVVRTRRKRLFA